MESILGQDALIASLLVAVYFAMFALNGLVNLYLRSVDQLPIDRADVKSLARYAGYAVLFVGMAGLFRLLPFFMALCFLICGYLISLIVKAYLVGKQLTR